MLVWVLFVVPVKVQSSWPCWSVLWPAGCVCLGGIRGVCIFGVCPQPQHQLGLGKGKVATSHLAILEGPGNPPGSHRPPELVIVSSLLAGFWGMLDLHSGGTFLTWERPPHPSSLVPAFLHQYHTPMVGQRPPACGGADPLGAFGKSLRPLGFVSLSLRWGGWVFEPRFWHAYTALIMLLGQNQWVLGIYWAVLLERILILQHAKMEVKIAPCTKQLLDKPRARCKLKVRKIKKDFV